MTLHDLPSFYLPWAAAAIAASTEAPIDTAHILHFEGLELPVLQMGLAIAGVLMARPLAPRRAAESGWVKHGLVTVIMLLIALAWVTESHPGLLYTFVVSIGLGFSGYALIELAGTQIETFIKRIFSSAAAGLGSKEDKQ